MCSLGVRHVLLLVLVGAVLMQDVAAGGGGDRRRDSHRRGGGSRRDDDDHHGDSHDGDGHDHDDHHRHRDRDGSGKCCQEECRNIVNQLTECQFTTFQGFSYRNIATNKQMIHLPQGDGSAAACAAKCHCSPSCVGFEYVLTPSNAGNATVTQTAINAFNLNQAITQIGGRYFGPTSTSYAGHDCMKRCVAIVDRTLLPERNTAGNNFITNDPLVTFYEKNCIRKTPPTFTTQAELYRFRRNLYQCQTCLPPVTPPTTTPVTPDPGCPGDDFLNTLPISVTGLPATDIIPGATTLAACKTACLGEAYATCPGFFLIGTTCYRWNQNSNTAGTTVNCQATGTNILYLRLQEPSCQIPDFSQQPSGNWGVFADVSLPSGFGFPGLPQGDASLTAMCCQLACSYDPTCCAVDYNPVANLCVRHNVAGNSIPFSCNNIQRNTGNTVHYARPSSSNPCVTPTNRYTAEPGFATQCQTIAPP